MKTIQIGLIGLGTVGTGVVKTITQNKELLESRIGAPINLKYVADIDINRQRDIQINKDIMVSDGNIIVNDPDIDIVIELVGGCGIAKQFILGALANGKSVVTANKALLAECGEEVFERVKTSRGIIGFEASVAGGIPVIKALREGLSANNILNIYGIINGTANYILTKMTRDKVSFAEALKEAQKLGYAEADPTFDVEGIDSAHKLLLLGSIASGCFFSMNDVVTEGITKITDLDIKYAAEFGYVIKLLAIYKYCEGKVELRVHPTLIPKENLLASVMDSYNAVFVKGDIVGNNMYYGRGAGQLPTASAVMADVVDIARGIAGNSLLKRNDFHFKKGGIAVKNIMDIETRYYMRFQVTDQPGVLAQISGILGKRQISISDVYQKERRVGDVVPLIMITHHAREKDVREALVEIDKLDVIKEKTLYIRMED